MSESPQPRTKFPSRLALLSILLLSAFLQFSSVSRTIVDSPLRADAGQYFLSAYNLRHYGVYSSKNTWPAETHIEAPMPDAVRPPGYPLLLLLIGDPRPNDAYVSKVCYTQAALAVVTVWMFFLICSQLLPPGYSHAATLLTALDPHLAVMSTLVLTETLFTLLLYASIFCLLKALRPENRAWALAAGLLLGFCGLTRPTLQLLPVVALAATFILASWRTHRRMASLVLCGFLLVMSPSIIRNQTVPDAAPQSNLQVNFLLHGSYPGFMYDNQPESYGFPYRFDPRAADAGSSIPKAVSYIAERVRHQPLTYLKWYLLGKPGYFLGWSDAQGPGDILIFPELRSPYFESPGFIAIRQGMHLLHWPLMLAGILGILVLWWPDKARHLNPFVMAGASLVAILFLYALVLHMVGAPFARYGIPFRPLLYPLALLGATSAWSGWKRRRLRHSRPEPAAS